MILYNEIFGEKDPNLDTKFACFIYTYMHYIIHILDTYKYMYKHCVYTYTHTSMCTYTHTQLEGSFI